MQPGIGKGVFIQRECKFTVKKQRKSAFLCLFNLRHSRHGLFIDHNIKVYLCLLYTSDQVAAALARRGFSHAVIREGLSDDE